VSGLRSAIVVGATGLVGRALVDDLEREAGYGEIHLLARRKVKTANKNVHCIVADFDHLADVALPAADDLFCCLGTTIKVAGSREAFYKVDYTYVMESARAARRAGVRRLALVTAGGSSVTSPVFYSRVKGEVERDVATLGFDMVAILRPSMLMGDREKLGQPVRSFEQLALRLSGSIGPFIPARFRPIAAASVARGLVLALQRDQGGVTRYENDRILQLAASASNGK